MGSAYSSSVQEAKSIPAISAIKKDVEIPITALKRWIREILKIIAGCGTV
jgi:hypothetical protein